MKLARLLGPVLCLGLASRVLAGDLPPVGDLPSNAALPDPFVMFDGTPVKTPEDWNEKRRPELKRLFEHYMYGYAPEPAPIEATLTQENDDLFGGKATLKQIEIRFTNLPEDAPRIHLALFVPNKGGPAPVFLALNKCGNQTVVSSPYVIVYPDTPRHGQCPDNVLDVRGGETDFWCVEYLIDRGYAFATFHESDIDPDEHDFTDGIHPFFENLPGPKESRWGTIAAWAWGLQRCVDYLVTDKDVDAKRIAVTGHSRRGKTALLAGAFDERIALVVPHQSGTGGAALSRDNDQETVARINQHFPHWFSDTFTKFDRNEAQLPIDQHLLMALVAPRTLLDTEGLEDTWANYNASFRGMQEADRVWKFLGKRGMVLPDPIKADVAISPETVGELAQYRLDTKHTLNRDYWRAILDFADVQYGR